MLKASGFCYLVPSKYVQICLQPAQILELLVTLIYKIFVSFTQLLSEIHRSKIMYLNFLYTHFSKIGLLSLN